MSSPIEQSEALDLLADFHPVPAVASQLRERAAEDREIERQRGEDTIALIKELQLTVKNCKANTKAEWIAYAEALETLIGEFDV